MTRSISSLVKTVEVQERVSKSTYIKTINEPQGSTMAFKVSMPMKKKWGSMRGKWGSMIVNLI